MAQNRAETGQSVRLGRERGCLRLPVLEDARDTSGDSYESYPAYVHDRPGASPRPCTDSTIANCRTSIHPTTSGFCCCIRLPLIVAKGTATATLLPFDYPTLPPSPAVNRVCLLSPTRLSNPASDAMTLEANQDMRLDRHIAYEGWSNGSLLLQNDEGYRG